MFYNTSNKDISCVYCAVLDTHCMLQSVCGAPLHGVSSSTVQFPFQQLSLLIYVPLQLAESFVMSVMGKYTVTM